MSPFLDRLQKEKELQGAVPAMQSGSDPANTLASLYGNIREWLGDGERSGLLRVTSTRVRLRDERTGTCETDGLGVDFGKGRFLEVAPGTSASDRVDMHFQGCRKIGSIKLQRRGEHWWVWPKNSVRQLPVPWDDRVFLALLDDMV